MIMERSITRAEQFSGALKSFLQTFRSILAKRGATSCDHEGFTRDWGAFLNEALQQSDPSSQEERERQAAIAQVMQSADVGTKTCIADFLLFANNINEAYDAIIMLDQQRREAA